MVEHGIVRASVIICVYNRGMQVQACLASLLAMAYQDFEIVLVDDGSTDDTAARLETFRKDHPQARVTITRCPHNLGVSGARNVGIDAARGDLVFFTDSDCVVGPGWLGAMVRAFDDPAIAAAAGLVYDASPRTWADRAYAGSCRIGQAKVQARGLVGNNMGFRREVAARFRFDPALSYYCDDDDMARRLSHDGFRIAFVPEALVHHNHHLNFWQYLRMAHRQGQGSARYWYKHSLWIGRDMRAIVAALATLPLGLLDGRLLAVPLFFLLLQAAAVLYSEAFLKAKGVLEALKVLPLCSLYYLVKTWSVLATLLRIVAGRERGIRESRKRWREHCSARRQARLSGATG